MQEEGKDSGILIDVFCLLKLMVVREGGTISPSSSSSFFPAHHSAKKQHLLVVLFFFHFLLQDFCILSDQNRLANSKVFHIVSSFLVFHHCYFNDPTALLKSIVMQKSTMTKQRGMNDPASSTIQSYYNTTRDRPAADTPHPSKSILGLPGTTNCLSVCLTHSRL